MAFALIAMLFASPTLAAAALVCVIVVAADRASSTEIYRHELAHCNGWIHPDQHHKGRPRKAYQSPKPPERFVRPYAGKVLDH